MKFVHFGDKGGAILICSSMTDGVAASTVSTLGGKLWGGTKISMMAEGATGTDVHQSLAVYSKATEMLTFKALSGRHQSFVYCSKFTFNVKPVSNKFAGRFFGGEADNDMCPFLIACAKVWALDKLGPCDGTGTEVVASF